MSYKKNNFGFGAVGVVIVILVLAVVGLAGYIVWDKSKNTVSETNKVSTLQTFTNKENQDDIYSQAIPKEWVNKTDTTLRIDYAIPQEWTKGIEITKYAVDEKISVGFGAPVWVKYNLRTNKWETLDVDDNGNPTIVRSNSLISEISGLVENKYTAVYYVTGDGTGAQIRILVLKESHVYQFSFPPTCEDKICDGDVSWTLIRMKSSTADFIKTINFQN